jgi:hypothetical protein
MNVVTNVEVVRYPVLRVTFADGFSGDYDLTDFIDRSEGYPELRDPAFFAGVAVAERGRSFGWRLDEEGEEIDFCPDATRITIETRLVEALADQYRRQLHAAE